MAEWSKQIFKIIVNHGRRLESSGRIIIIIICLLDVLATAKSTYYISFDYNNVNELKDEKINSQANFRR